MVETATVKTSDTRGRARVRLAGPALTRAGFTPGTFCWVLAKPGLIEIIHATHPSACDRDLALVGWHARKVTGRPGRGPRVILDGDTVLLALGDAAQADIKFKPGCVLVRPHEET